VKTTRSIPAKLLSAACALLLVCAVAQADTTKKTSTSAGKSATTTHKTTRKGKRARKASWRRGQQKIDPKRAREIQEALIREHYLEGQPTGMWDARTTAAMRKFQSDQGWQSKVVPDSRALIKLGLGPSHENDLNPELMGDGAFSPLRTTTAPQADIAQR